MTEPTPAHPVCSQCNYDLFGITPHENGHITCPECGVLLRPMDPGREFTRKKLHAHFFKRLLLPTSIPAFCVFFLAIFTPIGALISCFLLPITAVIALVLFLESSSSAVTRARPHPRPMPLWSIPLIALLYLIPFPVLLILAMRMNPMFLY